MAEGNLTQQRVRELFIYRAGALFWRIKKSNVPKGAEVAGGSTQRYKQVGIDGTNYAVHRVIFLWHHGYMPALVDHKNRDTHDNTITNLRDATHSINICNSDRNDHASGASLNKRSGRWRASIFIDNRQRHLGYFDTRAEAERAYAAMKKEIRNCSPSFV